MLSCEVPRIVAALRDELWPVREAALQTLRKLRPEQLQRLSREVLHFEMGSRFWIKMNLTLMTSRNAKRTEDFWLFTTIIPTMVWRATA